MTPFTMEKIAVLAPIPSASVRIITTLNAGARSKPRKAWRISWRRWSTVMGALTEFRPPRFESAYDWSASGRCDMTRVIVGVVLVTAAFVAVRPVGAHHSFAAQYDRSK